ncbi:DUF7225 domain-containing protein [Cytobacillus dafuensis]|uniref:Uncharacterized protein n=1 Tax=Cytobacillus dafuensis TaxID=1742359 RepID=A0A5B8ZBN3_CYTDA|nr:hypothetical protein [Cytobacillus dafuensis]QED49079.1 hypothetical protein FSZ17_18500 [Cytobacillus dafuensis]
MTIYEQIKHILNARIGEAVTAGEVKELLLKEYGTNPSSIILSDYCYNRYNQGIAFTKHLFLYINRSTYKYIGENAPYTGFVYHKPKGEEAERIVGEWTNGVFNFFENHRNIEQDNEVNPAYISKTLVAKLFEEYFNILKFEMSTLNCKATELRHLIGRLGEFFCVLQTGGELARQTNQHGFDVLNNGRRISVKTTAQDSGFISINQNTFSQFDDFFVVQYIQDDFKVLFYGPKEQVPLARTYGSKYEVDINALKKMQKGSLYN